MRYIPSPFIPGLIFVGDLTIWFAPDGKPIILSCPLSTFGVKPTPEDYCDDGDDADDVDPDVPF